MTSTCLDYELMLPYVVFPTIIFPQDGFFFYVNVTFDITITCIAFGRPAPTIWFYFNDMLLERTDGVMGIGNDIPSRVQVGNHSTPDLGDNGTYVVTRSLTLFRVRDEPLTGFKCKAINNIPLLNLTILTLRFSVTFGICVLGKVYADSCFNLACYRTFSISRTIFFFYSSSNFYSSTYQYSCCIS